MSTVHVVPLHLVHTSPQNPAFRPPCARRNPAKWNQPPDVRQNQAGEVDHPKAGGTPLLCPLEGRDS